MCDEPVSEISHSASFYVHAHRARPRVAITKNSHVFKNMCLSVHSYVSNVPTPVSTLPFSQKFLA